MSERQVAVAVAMVRRDRAYAWDAAHADEADRVRKAGADTARADLIAAGATVPAERVTFTGTVEFTKTTDDPYRRGGLVIKARIRADAGWAVWGTLPAALLMQVADRPGGTYAGARVEITATIRPSDNDPLFGFAGRPTGRYIDA